MHGLMTTLDEEDEKIEIAGDERQLVSVVHEHSPAWREDEGVEPVAGHQRMDVVEFYVRQLFSARTVPTRCAVGVAFCLLVLLVWVDAASSEQGRGRRIGFSILEDYDNGEDLGEVEKDFALFRELGVTTWRGSFGWDDYEPSPGHYDFEWLHRFAALAARYGITLRPYLAYTPEWAAGGGADKDAWNDPPRDPTDWERFVRTLVTEMRGHRNVASYEIYNEENVAQWWDGSAARYNDVFQRAAKAVKAADPRAKVLLGGMVYPDEAWIEHVCGEGQSGSLIDIVPFHAYPETWTPPGVDVERYLGSDFADGFLHSVDTTCGRKPIWINETGFATVAGRSEHEQADWWVRAIVSFAAEPRVEQIGIYEIKDLQPERAAIGDVPNYHLGLTRTDRSRKLAFQTVRMMVALFGGTVTIEAPRTNPSTRQDLFVYAFHRDDGRQLVAAWTKSGTQIVDVSVTRRATRALEHRLDGSTIPYPAFTTGTLSEVELHPGTARVFELVP